MLDSSLMIWSAVLWFYSLISVRRFKLRGAERVWWQRMCGNVNRAALRVQPTVLVAQEQEI